MVAIKDMDMPKYCNDCDFVIDSFGYCNRAEEHIPNYEFYSETNERPDFCPLVEIEERKVGKWEFIGDNCFRCTECGAVYTTGQFNTVSNYREKRLFPKGCPNCGAEMRGAENE